MKIAILVFGELRQFKQAVQTWKFKDELDCDFYFSTWNRSFQYNSKLGIDLNEVVTKEDILKYLPDASINLVDQPQLHIKNTDGHIPKRYDNSIAMKYHWQQCLKQLENSNKEYDNVVVMRTDLYMEHPNWPSFFNNNSDDRVYAQGPLSDDEGHPFANDLFLMGTKFNITKIINYFNDDILLDHRTLANSILDNNLFIEALEFGIQIMRPGTRNFTNPDARQVNECSKQWERTHSEDDISTINYEL